MEKQYTILCINPGSASTKLALFRDDVKLDESSIEHSNDELRACPDILSQLPMRRAAVYSYLELHGVSPSSIDAIAARGCPAGRSYRAGAYEIDQSMVEACTTPAYAVLPMCLSPVIAYEWVTKYGTPAFSYDVVMVDELKDVARITGLPTVKRNSSAHTLNTKAVAREVASELGLSYEDVNLIMCHLGGGCSVSMHERGRITDMVPSGEGSFTPFRAGRLSNRSLIKMCFSGKYTEKSLREMLQGRGGLIAHLGTNDCREVESMIARGDSKAKLIYEAFAYNIAKDIGMMAVTTGGKVDRIVLTGGIAHSKILTGMIVELVRFIAPVVIKPGAREMEALAGGVLRVLRGEETAHKFSEVVPVPIPKNGS